MSIDLILALFGIPVAKCRDARRSSRFAFFVLHKDETNMCDIAA